MRITIIISYMLMISALVSCQNHETNADRILNVSANDFYELIQDSTNILIDVRTKGEFSKGHIEGAIQIDYNSNDFRSTIDTLDKSKTVLLYCRSGHRSANAAKILGDLDFTKNLQPEKGNKGMEEKT